MPAPVFLCSCFPSCFRIYMGERTYTGRQTKGNEEATNRPLLSKAPILLSLVHSIHDYRRDAGSTSVVSGSLALSCRFHRNRRIAFLRKRERLDRLMGTHENRRRASQDLPPVLHRQRCLLACVRLAAPISMCVPSEYG